MRRAVSLFITGAKLWFMVAGYVVQFALPRALGSPARFGVWVIVLALVSPVNNVMVTATIQGVSQVLVGDRGARGRGARAPRCACRRCSAAAWRSRSSCCAPLIAWLRARPVADAVLRLASGVVLCLRLLRGLRRRGQRRARVPQAGRRSTSPSRRCAPRCVVGAALVDALGAGGGGRLRRARPALILVISIVRRRARAGPSTRAVSTSSALVRFFGGVAVYLFIVNLLMFVDGLLLKRAGRRVGGRERAAADPAGVANAQAGFYGAVQAIARIPYQLILAVTFVIFPLVSKSTFDKDVGQDARLRRSHHALLAGRGRRCSRRRSARGPRR